MNTNMGWIARSFIIGLAVGMVGCGAGFQSGTSSSTTSAAQAVVNIDDEMAKAAQAKAGAEQAIAEANAAIASITDANGNIKIDLFKKSQTNTSGLLAPLVAKLQPLFDNVYAKVAVVKTQLDSARLALTDALGKLPSNDPQSAAIIAQIKQQMAQIDSMEAAFKVKVHQLAAKLTLAITGIDKVVAQLVAYIPIPGAAFFGSMLVDMVLMDDVKQLILDLQAKLFAL